MATLRSAKLKLKGVLSPSRWNSREELVEATLSLEDGGTYLVEAQRQWDLIEEHMEEYVVVEGVLKSRGGKRFLEILTVAPAEDGADGDWSDNEEDDDEGYEQEYEEDEDDEDLD